MPRKHKRKNRYVWRARPELNEERTVAIIRAYFELMTAQDTAEAVGLSRQTVSQIFKSISQALMEWRKEELNRSEEINGLNSIELIGQFPNFDFDIGAAIRAINFNSIFLAGAELAYQNAFVNRGPVVRYLESAMNSPLVSAIYGEPLGAEMPSHYAEKFFLAFQDGKSKGLSVERCVKRALILIIMSLMAFSIADLLTRAALKNENSFKKYVQRYGKLTKERFLSHADAIYIQKRVNEGLTCDIYSRLEAFPLRLNSSRA